MHGPTTILWPVAAHLALISCLYLWLTVERRRAVRRGAAAISDYRTYDKEPLRARLISNNLSNQFELPVLFYVLATTLYATEAVSSPQLFLAWVFIVARIAHSLVHILSADVALRGSVFAVNFLALALMWAAFLAQKLLGLMG